ncbi:nickel-binding protein [Leptothermofonsia sp. ETS-13]|uniref:nickel-binding protein n=1 Tax=Leptothermofonsia sp. ETS-13 TaxID=3035696 RepID=UPI003B9F32F7
MARIILDCSYAPPIKEFDLELHPCFVAHGITWVRSFVAVDGTRSICEFKAPYAELVRDACRQGGIPYDQVWRAEICLEQSQFLRLPGSTLVITEVVDGKPIASDEWITIQKTAQTYFQNQDIQSVLSLVSVGGRYAIAIFTDTNMDDVHKACCNANIPLTRIWRSRLVVPGSHHRQSSRSKQKF